MFKAFWSWYNKHYTLNISIAAGLFLLQIIHLLWLATHVITMKLTGTPLWSPNNFWENVIILVDYTEIPALVTTGLIYVNELRKKYNFKSALFIVLLSSQLLHMFWITDEFVLSQFTHNPNASLIALPVWLAWVAIMIDYLEMPVIIDTFKKVYDALKTKNKEKLKGAFKE